MQANMNNDNNEPVLSRKSLRKGGIMKSKLMRPHRVRERERFISGGPRHTVWAKGSMGTFIWWIWSTEIMTLIAKCNLRRLLFYNYCIQSFIYAMRYVGIIRYTDNTMRSSTATWNSRTQFNNSPQSTTSIYEAFGEYATKSLLCCRCQ